VYGLYTCDYEATYKKRQKALVLKGGVEQGLHSLTAGIPRRHGRAFPLAYGDENKI
jgi:hypothetical protein